MKTPLAGLAITALLTVGSAFPGFAEDAAKAPAADAPAAAPTTAPADTTPGTAPRPSILSKKTDPNAAGPRADQPKNADQPKTAEQPAADDAAPARHHRRYARHHHHYWGNYRYAYWEPFPIFFPHIYHNRIHWNRIPWLIQF